MRRKNLGNQMLMNFQSKAYEQEVAIKKLITLQLFHHQANKRTTSESLEYPPTIIITTATTLLYCFIQMLFGGRPQKTNKRLLSTTKNSHWMNT